MADDFQEVVKKVLAARVGNLCSNPDCRALTSGPQQNPAKALNIGIAAHITAASVGGPRYDPDLLPEERSGPPNGIWLCQNCAKLVDNDPTRFTVDLLRKWKTNAEADARKRVGKTANEGVSPALDLKPYDRVRIEPIVPRHAEQAEWILQPGSADCFIFQKTDSQGYAEIPGSFIERVHRFNGTTPAVLRLTGRLQWNSVAQRWQIFSEKPEPGFGGQYGFSKYVDFDFPRRMNYAGEFAWCREDRLSQCLSQGRFIFYVEDGMYLRVRDLPCDQILVSSRP